jgi:hypothetical protein
VTITTTAASSSSFYFFAAEADAVHQVPAFSAVETVAATA